MTRDIFRAIADPTRRSMLGLLAAQAMTPTALAAHFDSSRQAVSKHLNVLVECRAITPHQRGREVYYHINPQSLQEIDTWLDRFRTLWNDRFMQLDDVLTTL